MHNSVEIAKNVLKLESDAISNLVNKIDKNFEKAVQLIINCKGRLLVIGVGKSGHIGKKIAATLASTGQPSFFIHATEAVHGDLGMLVENDICLFLSHSGNTKELLALVPAIKRIGLPIISITANLKSKLANYSDVVRFNATFKEVVNYEKI